MEREIRKLTDNFRSCQSFDPKIFSQPPFTDELCIKINSRDDNDSAPDKLSQKDVPQFV
jgi:hypothetical protein